MVQNVGQRRRSRRSFAFAILALLVVFAAGCGSSSGQATQQEKVQQIKDQIGQMQRYVGEHRTGSGGHAGPKQHDAKLAAGFERCPRRALAALPLTPDAERFAEAIARRRVGRSPQITVTVRPATHAGARGHEVRFLCGPTIARRALVVFTWDHRFDSGPNASASLAQHALVVSRFADGYRIWYVEH
jgi:hypothetical protein